jgi:hypothetical protein
MNAIILTSAGRNSYRRWSAFRPSMLRWVRSFCVCMSVGSRARDVKVPEMSALEKTFNATAAALGTARRAKDVMRIDAHLHKGK